MCRIANNQSVSPAAVAHEAPDCLPFDSVSQTVHQYASQHLHPTILNHSIRVYLHASQLALREKDAWIQTDRISILFATCMLQDIGTSATHDGPQRFEVEGADAAVAVVQAADLSMSKEDLHDIWVGIALHTSPGIAERISPLARLVRLAVLIDFKRPAALALTTQEAIDAIELEFPRGEIEKVLGDMVVEQAVRRPEKAPPASWPGVLLRSSKENPGWEGVNQAF